MRVKLSKQWNKNNMYDRLTATLIHLLDTTILFFAPDEVVTFAFSSLARIGSPEVGFEKNETLIHFGWYKEVFILSFKEYFRLGYYSREL